MLRKLVAVAPRVLQARDRHTLVMMRHGYVLLLVLVASPPAVGVPLLSTGCCGWVTLGWFGARHSVWERVQTVAVEFGKSFHRLGRRPAYRRR